MPERRTYKKATSLILTILLIGVGILAWNNKWEIHDRFSARSYVPTQDSEEVLENLKLTEKGETVFKASKTKVDGKEAFKTECPVDEYESASVLGCYSSRKIYVLKVDEPKLKGVEEVTAAHELLHAMYERLDAGEISKIRPLLDSARDGSNDQDINELIGSYKAQLGEGEELNNEMFAIFGTQLSSVDAELESIYDDYFRDRAGIVQMYKSYSSEFKAIEGRVASYDQELAKLKSQKEVLEAEINALGSELEEEKADLDLLKNSSDTGGQYQSQAAAYNQKVGTYNSNVERIRNLVAEYNDLVVTRNNEALSAKSLADQLDASVDER